MENGYGGPVGRDADMVRSESGQLAHQRVAGAYRGPATTIAPPRPLGEIGETLMTGEKVLEELHAVIGDLEALLSGVLLPPGPENETSRDARGFGSDVAARIHAGNNKVEAATRRLSRLAQRVAL